MSNYGLPDGVSLGMVAAVLIPVGIVTVLLRALPFSLLRVLKSSPFIDFLALLMPVGVMTFLVGYSDSPTRLLAALLALSATLLLHWWKRRADVSIFAGTALFMFLVNVVSKGAPKIFTSVNVWLNIGSPGFCDVPTSFTEGDNHEALLRCRPGRNHRPVPRCRSG